MKDNPNRCDHLIDSLLDGTITTEESLELLEVLRKCPESVENLRASFYIDALLHEVKKELTEEIENISSSDLETNTVWDTSLVNPTESDLVEFDRLVALDRNATPIHSPLLESPGNNSISGQTTLSYYKAIFSTYLLFKKKHPLESPQKPKVQHKPSWPFWTRLFLFFGFITWLSIQPNPIPSDHDEPEVPPIAILQEVIDPKWENNTPQFKRGQELGMNRLALKSGMIKILMNNKVEIVLEGPGDLTLNDPLNAYCASGKLSVHVPPEATGFQVKTPYAFYVDRGTDFTVSVEASESRIDVIKGIVDVASPVHRPVLRLKEGLAIRTNHLYESTTVPADTSRFVNAEKFASRLYSYLASFRLEKKKKELLLDKRNDLLVRFCMMNREQSNVPNCSARGKELCRMLNVFNGKWCEGSTCDSNALVLGGGDRYAVMNIPGQYRDMTLFMKIRIDQFANQGNILLVSDSLFDSVGAIMWQISREGHLLFYQTINNKKENITFDSGPVFNTSLRRLWYTVAVTVNSSTHTTTQYLDGRPVSRHKWTQSVPLAVGECYIGNILKKELRKNNRDFNGAIEDILVFDRALSDREIANIF